MFSIIFTGAVDAPFEICEGYIEDREEGKALFPTETSITAVGTSSNYEVHLRIEHGYIFPSLLTSRVSRKHRTDKGVKKICGRNHTKHISDTWSSTSPLYVQP